MKTLHLDCSDGTAEEIISKIAKDLQDSGEFIVTEVDADKTVISPVKTTSSSYHPVSHSKDEQKVILNRLSRIVGHLESVKRMVTDNRNANDILVQLAAIASSVNSTARVIIKGHFKYSIDNAAKKSDEEAFEKLYGLIDKFLK
ncbi:MAG: metal-sensing transcriptional repressor [Ruminococcaceae bacterium]|nr:metal-sensing transcriptional repressor [Oscillospiraceae bacterium]